jgi:regulatory protein
LDQRQRDSALNAAVGALRRRERTSAELHAWLGERGIDEELVEDVIAELVEIGELDDERFAFAYAEDKRDLSGWGAERIEAALVDRGLGRSLAERAAGEPRDAQLERAVTLLEGRGTDLADEAERSRALSFLTRRGYEYELAYDAIRERERTA